MAESDTPAVGDEWAWLRDVQRSVANMPEAVRLAVVGACVRDGRPNHELNVFDPARRDEWIRACLRCGSIHHITREPEFYLQGYQDGSLGRWPLFGGARLYGRSADG